MSSHYSFVHLSVGDLLRKSITSSTPTSTSTQVQTYINEGKIVPVAISLTLVRDEMLNFPPQTTFLIDGFPRNHDNLQGWNSLMPDVATVARVLCYDCPVGVLEQRILARANFEDRTDDNIVSARKRFDTFQRDTMPVVKRLEEKGLVKHIRGDQELEKVWADTVTEVDEIVRAQILQVVSNPDLKMMVVDELIRADWAKSREELGGEGGEIERDSVTTTIHGKTAVVKLIRTNGNGKTSETLTFERQNDAGGRCK
ncbi:hypothetical protein ScalyP_jg5432 [Parmales sp. scaly parma]|nr:hypothetical protein ScalyP_jg5432 [Parmales sp. scaly parma]